MQCILGILCVQCNLSGYFIEHTSYFLVNDHRNSECLMPTKLAGELHCPEFCISTPCNTQVNE